MVRPRKPHELKPWPSACYDEYHRITELAQDITDIITEVQQTGLHGVRDWYTIKDNLPRIRRLSRDIQTQCSYYDGKRSRRFARWAGNAIIEIDYLAAGIVSAMEDAWQKYNQKPRDIYTVEFAVEEALNYASRIFEQLAIGPAPEPPSVNAQRLNRDLWSEAVDCVDRLDDDRRTSEGPF